MKRLTVKELEDDMGKAEYIYLTEQSIKELAEGLPIHCEQVILIPRLTKV